MAKNTKALNDEQLNLILSSHKFEILNFINIIDFKKYIYDLKLEDSITTNIFEAMEPKSYISVSCGRYNKLVIHDIDKEFSINSIAGNKVSILPKEMQSWINEYYDKKTLTELHNSKCKGSSLEEIPDTYKFEWLVSCNYDALISKLTECISNAEVLNKAIEILDRKKFIAVSLNGYDRTVIHSITEPFSIIFTEIHCKRTFTPDIMEMWFDNFSNQYSLIEVLNANRILEVMGQPNDLTNISRQLERKSSKVMVN